MALFAVFPRGVLNKVLCGEALHWSPTPYPFITISSKNGTPFVYLPLINSTPFTYPVYNFAPLLTAVNALSSNMNKSKSQKTFSTFSHQQHSSVARLSNFTVWNDRYPYPFIYLKPGKGTYFGRSLPPPPPHPREGFSLLIFLALSSEKG